MVPKDKTSSPIDSLYPNAPIRGPKKSPGRPPKKDPAKTQAEAPVATYSGRGSQTIVRKSNDLIQNAMSTLTLSQQKLMLHIFAMIKPSDTELPRYEMSIYEFLKLCGVDPHNGSMYAQVRNNIDAIANAKVQWIRLAGTQKITMFRWLSGATIDEGTGKIVLTLDQALKPHLIQLKEFYTTMNITYTLPMKSQYSLKIYELCKSYQNLYLTKKQKGEPLVWNIETLKKQVDCNATNWAHVRRTVLDKAKSEINGHTDIYFDYEVYEKDRQRVIAVAVTIEPVDKQVADDKLNEITKSMSSKSRGKKKLTPAETGSLDDDPSILTLEYVSVPETTIPYSYGATPDLLRQELEVKAELDKLNRELTADEMEAVHTMIGAMVKMAGTPRGNDKMIDGGNAHFFQTVNNVIDNCGGLRRWFEGAAARYATRVIPVARTKSAPLPYLSKAILDDLENYRMYVTSGVPEPLGGYDAAPEQPDIVETTDFVETDAEPVNQLMPEDAATKKQVMAALLRYIDRDALSARLTTGQMEAFDDILQMTAYFCRRNVKGKDDGMMEGKANMQFLNALNKVIARYESLTPLYEAMAVMMDYDTYWKDLMKNPKIKNPKLVFQSEVERALLMPAAVIGEYTARKAQNDPRAVHKEYDWVKAFEE
ncbi:replication initiation protein [Gemmiger formicilis]|mgnify:FL=1|uniref:replication initiation protein n=1 Tax=Gemmiger TaxID=204475 RepID=UPI001C02C546|nr:replication initiation protein [Gemmiger formicilis]MBT9673730.1 RepB family plasmid replication initiator protein [Gemmiger formicilis]